MEFFCSFCYWYLVRNLFLHSLLRPYRRQWNLKLYLKLPCLIKVYTLGTKTLRMLTELHHKKTFCFFLSVPCMAYLYPNEIVGDTVKLYTGSKNLHHEVPFLFSIGNLQGWKNTTNKNHIYTLYRFMIDLHPCHLLSYHLSEAGIIFTLWMRKQGHRYVNGLLSTHLY